MNPNSPLEISKLDQMIPQGKQELDSYDRSLKQGKKVLDCIHLELAAKQSKQNKLNGRENMPIIPIAIHEKYQNQKEMLPQAQLPSDQINKDYSQPCDNSKQQQLQFLRNNKKPSKLFIGCNCQKSKCSKNYCECFTQGSHSYHKGRKCNSELCKCQGCENNSENQNRYRSMELDQGERACFCKKSNCLKKYCQCYNNGLKCTANCKCEECKNCVDERDNEPEQEDNRDVRKQRSEEEIEEINSKLDQIARITPQENQEYVLSFLEYWLT